ncbi:hypothetical protein QN224_01465 [Sinorhizobium sp. 8-89]|uniref:SRPBCC domain-containing protein n=1 Tax=Sinorhizobium sp. 7-81 TaxID=3049087 RepID=UPI0024C404AA|nr:SRPBCC domain-containing protein [Sinorhizobium sp. 7-81]MDK1384071.1 hypothetical protein [Sinorhizobium sp. 7-81]
MMVDESAKGRTDTASRVVKASPLAIYRALLDPAAVAVWLPPDGMRGEIERFEPREGGVYRMALIYEQPNHAPRGKTSAATDIVEGRFVQVIPGNAWCSRRNLSPMNPHLPAR